MVDLLFLGEAVLKFPFYHDKIRWTRLTLNFSFVNGVIEILNPRERFEQKVAGLAVSDVGFL